MRGLGVTTTNTSLVILRFVLTGTHVPYTDKTREDRVDLRSDGLCQGLTIDTLKSVEESPEDDLDEIISADDP